MIFKVSLFLASLSAASAGMRGQDKEKTRQLNRQLMGTMGSGVSARSAISRGSWEGTEWVGEPAPLTSVRSIEGTENQELAGLDAELQRFSGPAHYPDGQGLDVSMFTIPNARTVSNAVADMPDSIGLATVSDAFWQWGQFMDHDLGLTEGVEEVANIITEGCETGGATGVVTDDPICEIPFRRALSHYTPPLDEDPNGIREQLNEITAYVDASMVYGHNDARAEFLREGTGGRMKTSGTNGNLLPRGSTAPSGPEFANADNGQTEIADDLFIGGDPRVNEQLGLLSIHTLWVREHNRIADILNVVYDDTDENIYQLARKLVTAEIQHITYTEFLPLMIGSFAPDPDTFAFDSDVNPGIAQEFAACAFRVGHTFLSGNLLMHDGTASTGSISLVEAFFNPGEVVQFEGLVDELLIGQTNQAANQADIFVIDEVRTNLFGAPVGGIGLDLVALNVQRARDHGINKYNEVRAGYGLTRKTSFSEVSSNSEVVSRLEAAYGGDIDLCDPWLCGLAEDPASGLLGEMFSTIIGDQFTRSMNGDNFFYTGDPDVANPEMIAATGINPFQVTYADVINANTIGGVAPNAMEAP